MTNLKANHKRMLDVTAIRAFKDNYIWCLHDAAHAVVVDPGEAHPVLRFLADARLRLRAILVTHHHHDHVDGIPELLTTFPVPVFGPKASGIRGVSQAVCDGESVTLPFLNARFDVFSIPGHTLDHVAYYGLDSIFCGDTLFSSGCGRLFEGTPAQMLSSLERLGALPPDTRVYCGHEYTLENLRFARMVEPDNPALEFREQSARYALARGEPTLPSSIGLEKQANPFLRCQETQVKIAVQQHSGTSLASPLAVFTALRRWKDEFK